jgi:hypothetical protein
MLLPFLQIKKMHDKHIYASIATLNITRYYKKNVFTAGFYRTNSDNVSRLVSKVIGRSGEENRQ